MNYADQLYFVVKEQFDGLDSIYEDNLIHLIGTHGIYILQENKMLETCGVINDRQLYVLYDK